MPLPIAAAGAIAAGFLIPEAMQAWGDLADTYGYDNVASFLRNPIAQTVVPAVATGGTATASSLIRQGGKQVLKSPAFYSQLAKSGSRQALGDLVTNFALGKGVETALPIVGPRIAPYVGRALDYLEDAPLIGQYFRDEEVGGAGAGSLEGPTPGQTSQVAPQGRTRIGYDTQDPRGVAVGGYLHPQVPREAIARRLRELVNMDRGEFHHISSNQAQNQAQYDYYNQRLQAAYNYINHRLAQGGAAPVQDWREIYGLAFGA